MVVAGEPLQLSCNLCIPQKILTLMLDMMTKWSAIQHCDVQGKMPHLWQLLCFIPTPALL